MYRLVKNKGILCGYQEAKASPRITADSKARQLRANIYSQRVPRHSFVQAGPMHSGMARYSAQSHIMYIVN